MYLDLLHLVQDTWLIWVLHKLADVNDELEILYTMTILLMQNKITRVNLVAKIVLSYFLRILRASLCFAHKMDFAHNFSVDFF